MPSASRPFAISSTRLAAWGHETSTQPPSRSARYAGRAPDVSSRQRHVEGKPPIKNRRWCPVHEREVESDEIVRGWEVAKGQFVIVDDADLEAIERQNTSRSIDIERFVPLGEVDPV